ncbi:MAG TPA: hypothetical protein VIX82_12365 [Solirubrobacteraceae bacterium]
MAFHVQLRQFPHVARAFNLSAEELSASVLAPWVAGKKVHLSDQRWDPERARLTIYEGPQLRVDEIGLGRGWANVTRTGADVTVALLERVRGNIDGGARTDSLKAIIEARCALAPLALSEVVTLAGNEQMRASERLARAEQAVWELLHVGRVRLVRAGEAPAADQWRGVLLSWRAWCEPATALEGPPRGQATTSAISRERSESEANR